MDQRERQNMQNQTMSELYNDDNKSKYSSSSKDIIESAKKFHQKLYNTRKLPQVLLLNFLAKFLIENK